MSVRYSCSRQPLKLGGEGLTIAFARETGSIGSVGGERQPAGDRKRAKRDLKSGIAYYFQIVEALEKKVTVEEPLYEEHKRDSRSHKVRP